eukprot:gene760-942_t
MCYICYNEFAWVAELVDALVSKTNGSNIVCEVHDSCHLYDALRMNSQEPTIISQLVSRLISQSPHKHKLGEASVIHAWHCVMPDIVKRRTDQVYVKNNTLFVKLSSAPLRQELQNTKHKMLQMLQDQLTDYTIADIIFIA